MGDEVTIQVGDLSITYTEAHGLVLRQGENEVVLNQEQAGGLVEFYAPILISRR